MKNKNIYILSGIVSIAVILILIDLKFSFSSIFISSCPKSEIFKPVYKELKERGCDTNFIKSIITDERTEFDKKYIKINILGYLNPPDYSKLISSKAEERSKQFIKENFELLNNCEKKYNVPKEIITAILWVESKFGEHLGNNHIVSVFLSSALANMPDYIYMNIESAKKDFSGNEEEFKKLENNIRERAKRKSEWAINELICLEQMQKQKNIPVLSLKGSWAGAFGISQFLPSSYLKYAIDGNNDGKIDLFSIEDAIYSTANYLANNGWSNNIDDQKKAIYSYNNSYAYVNTILSLSQKIK